MFDFSKYANPSLQRIQTYPSNAIDPDLPLYAKSPPSANKGEEFEDIFLSKHSLEVASHAIDLWETIQSPITDRYPGDLIKAIVFLSGLFHDFGKACAGFQALLLNNDINRWPPDRGGYRHEIISMIIAFQNINAHSLVKLFPSSLSSDQALHSVLFGIVTHHRPLSYSATPSNYLRIPLSQWPPRPDFEKMMDELMLNEKRLKKMWTKEIIPSLKMHSFSSQLLEARVFTNKLTLHPWSSLKDRLSRESDYLPEGYSPQLDFSRVEKIDPYYRLLLALVRGLTIGADHLRSGNRFTQSIPALNTISFLGNHEPRPFQERMQNINGNAMLRAPTGSGKTEAALLWAQNNQMFLDGRPVSRLFYVLPHTASINAMHKRFLRYFQQTNLITKNASVRETPLLPVGIQHSKATVALFTLLEDRDYKILLHEKRSKKALRHLVRDLEHLTREIYYPIKITTPHQLLRIFLQGKGWELQSSELYDSLVIFDEIHAYDPYLSGLIVAMAKTLSSPPYNAKVLFMSATFPTHIQQLLRAHVDNSMPLIELNPNNRNDNVFLEASRHHIKIIKQPPTRFLQSDPEKTKKLLLSSPSTLIIVNTVSTAQSIFEYLNRLFESESVELFLIHSRFKAGDRAKKERIIQDLLKKASSKHPLVVVSTQVIEVSLDVDFHRGIIEISPLDSLIQRLGRINRKGKFPIDKPNVLVLTNEPLSTFVYPKRLETSLKILEAHLEKLPVPVLAENAKIELVEKLYHEEPWDEQELREFNNTIQNELLQSHLRKIIPGTYRSWVKTVIDQPKASIEVILEEDLDKASKLTKKRNHVELLNLTIPIRSSKKTRGSIEYVRSPGGRGYLPFPILLRNAYRQYDEKYGLLR